MRRWLNLLLMTLLTAALAVSWQMLRTDAPPAPLPEVTASPTYEMLYERDVRRFRTLHVTLASGETYAVRSDMVYDEAGRLLGVRNSLGQPVVVEGQEDFPLDETAWQMMLLTAQHLPYTARYDSLDWSACGLDSPAAKLTVACDDGDAFTLRIGRAASGGASCYVALEGSPAVYLMPDDFRQVMTRPLREQHRLPTAVSYTEKDAVQLAVDGLSEGRIMASRHSEPGRVLPWQVDAPIRHAGSTERIGAFIAAVCALHADAWEATVTDPAAFAAYGLDQPLRLVIALADGTIRDIRLGRDAGDGTVYARMDPSGDVYRIGRDQLSFLNGLGLNSLLDRFVALISVNTVSQVTVATADETITLSQRWEDDTAVLPVSCAINGAALPQKDFAHRYAALIGLQFDKPAPADALPGAAWVEVAYQLRDGSEYHVAVYDHDHDYALVQTDGGGRFLLRRGRIQSMLDTLKEDANHETH